MTVWSFFGEAGRRALTSDDTGACLPPEYEPWVRYKVITLGDGSDADQRAAEAIERQGYYIYTAADHPPEVSDNA